MKEKILNGECPFCSSVGFKNIALHCFLKHGIKTRELRDMAGFTYSESICAKELHDACRERMLGVTPSALGISNKKDKQISVQGLKILKEAMSKRATAMPREMKVIAGRKGGLCNKGKVPWNKKYTHGRRVMYRRGCRCEECSVANKAFWKKINEGRKEGRKHGTTKEE
jgi:hypothetical protein